MYSLLKTIPTGEVSHIRTLNKKLASELCNEELFWAQEAQINWLQQGDSNTAYFHAKVIQKRRNFIAGLFNNEGVWKTSLNGIQAIAMDYFFHIHHTQNTLDMPLSLRVSRKGFQTI